MRQQFGADEQAHPSSTAAMDESALYPFTPEPAEEEGAGPVTRRWIEQRWMVDAMVQANGIRRAQPRLDAVLQSVGIEATPDVEAVDAEVSQHAAIPPALARAASRREDRADRALADGRRQEARSSYFIAANLYAAAQWGIAERNTKNLELNARKRISYENFARLADHPVEAVWIPFGDRALPGWLHLPAGREEGAAVPLVVSIPGMDGFKERFVPLTGDQWLERGVAVLVFEGPGQFESAVLGLRLDVDAWTRVGAALMDWAETRPELDTEAVGLVGSSLGSLLATVAVAHEPRFRACAVSATAFQPGLAPGFDSVHPFYKVRLMFLTGLYDEDAFEEHRGQFSWQEHATGMDRPYLVVSGDLDPMSPLRHARQLMAAVPGPRRLVVYENTGHGIGGSPAATRGPNFRALMAEWMVERLRGEPFESGEWLVDSGGTVHRRAL